MDSLIAIFFTSFVVGFSGAMMPGPLLAVTIAETPRRGSQTGSILTGGHAIAEVVVVVLLSLGLAAVMESRAVKGGIGIIGGAMLIFMGIGMLYGLLRQKTQTDAQAAVGKKGGRLVIDGIITSLSNPYWFVWWATTGAAFLIKSLEFGFFGPVVFYFGHILSDLVWYTVVSLLIWKGRKFIAGVGYKILIGACGLFLLYVGGLFIHDGIVGAI